jgi:hypothetical protein
MLVLPVPLVFDEFTRPGIKLGKEFAVSCQMAGSIVWLNNNGANHAAQLIFSQKIVPAIWQETANSLPRIVPRFLVGH